MRSESFTFERRQLAREAALERWRKARARQVAKDAGNMLPGERQPSEEAVAEVLPSIPNNLPVAKWPGELDMGMAVYVLDDGRRLILVELHEIMAGVFSAPATRFQIMVCEGDNSGQEKRPPRKERPPKEGSCGLARWSRTTLAATRYIPPSPLFPVSAFPQGQNTTGVNYF